MSAMLVRHLAAMWFAGLTGSLAFGGSSLAEDFAQHESHVHGEVELTVAMEGAKLVVELEAPAMNVVGFEHAPRTTQQQAQVRAAEVSLKSWQQLFRLPATANCQLRAASLVPPDWHEHDHEEKKGEAHAAYRARWTFGCASSAALTHIDAKIFSRLKAVEKLKVAIAARGVQREQVLSADQRVSLQ